MRQLDKYSLGTTSNILLVTKVDQSKSKMKKYNTEVQILLALKILILSMEKLWGRQNANV